MAERVLMKGNEALAEAAIAAAPALFRLSDYPADGSRGIHGEKNAES